MRKIATAKLVKNTVYRVEKYRLITTAKKRIYNFQARALNHSATLSTVNTLVY